MISEFLQFVLDCFLMVVKLFKNTALDGISYEVVIVSVCMLSIALASILVKFRGPKIK